MEGKEVQLPNGYVEITFTLPAMKAREVARKYLDQYSKFQYKTYVSNWCITKDNKIHFSIRRLSNYD